MTETTETEKNLTPSSSKIDHVGTEIIKIIHKQECTIEECVYISAALYAQVINSASNAMLDSKIKKETCHLYLHSLADKVIKILQISSLLEHKEAGDDTASKH